MPYYTHRGVYYNDYNRQKRVIKDIAYYAKDDIYCIMPVYRRNHIGEITCNYKDSITDFSYLSSVGIDTKPIVEVMYKYNYVNDNVDDKSVADTETLTNGKVFTIYKNNLLKDYIFPIWKYNGL